MENDINTIEPEIKTESDLTTQPKTNPSRLLIILGVIAIIGASIPVVVTKINDSNKSKGSDAWQVAVSPDPGAPTLAPDPESVNTILFGYKLEEEEVTLNAVNDSGHNNTKISLIKEKAKFIVPLANKKNLLYIGGIDDTDKGLTLNIETIKPKGDKKDSEEAVIYTATGGYRIDALVISENNEWIAWSENMPEAGSVDTHEHNHFRSYKANISGILKGTVLPIQPIPLNNEKGAEGVTVHMPSIITDDGQVYFNGIKPVGYFLHDGITDEAKKTILPVDSYNSKPYLINNRYLLYTSFEPLNNPLLPEGNKTSARQSVINRNKVKISDLQHLDQQPLVAAPGDEGEHYNHVAHISGDPSGTLRIAAEVFKKEGEKLVEKELQVITRLPSGKFEKKTIVDVPAGSSYRILAVGSKTNGNKTLIVGKEMEALGNLGSGWFIASSGYQKQLSSVIVYDIDSNSQSIAPEIGLSPTGEFLGILPKLPDDVIGIDRNEHLPALRDSSQLQLETFLPIEPKRKRTNFRSECEVEWQKKGYPNQEACDACPVYVYSDKAQRVVVKPKTPIFQPSAIPAINGNAWDFIADKQGNLLFPNETLHKRIDFLFPRGDVAVPESGVIIAKEDFSKKMYSYAKSLGFNDRESRDVVEYFLPDISDSNYIFMTHLSEDETKKLLDFDVTPKPTVQETRMFYVKRLSQRPVNQSLPPLFDPIVRKGGITVVTWGGIVE